MRLLILCFRNCGKINFERCPLSRFAVDIDMAAQLFYNAIDRGEPQARAFFLGCVERLEDVCSGEKVCRRRSA